MESGQLPNELKSWECSLDREHWETINALSKGKAKSRYLQINDYDWAEYTDVYCRQSRSTYPYTSDAFKKNAVCREIEFAYCGMRVCVDGEFGVIVGHNHSANLDVMFTDGKYKGQTMNCHPNWKISYYDSKGEVVKSFN